MGLKDYRGIEINVSKTGLLKLGTIDIWGQLNLFWLGAVLCIVRWLVASLVSTYLMTIAISSQLPRLNMSADITL